MFTPDSAVVQRPGGKVEWLKPKGPEHIVFEYWIFVWLGPNAAKKQKELFDRIRACSDSLGALAIICRRYESRRKAVQDFRDKYLTGPISIPFETLNAHHLLLEEVAVDIESFFWFANRLLTNIALTWNFFFKKIHKSPIPKGEHIRSHSTLAESATVLKQLPHTLQQAILHLKTEISDFRNDRIEHDMQFWRRESVKLVTGLPGITGAHETALFQEWSSRPLNEVWVSLHDYLTDVAKFMGSKI